MILLIADLEECGVLGKLNKSIKFHKNNARECVLSNFYYLGYILIYPKIRDISQEVRQRTANPSS